MLYGGLYYSHQQRKQEIAEMEELRANVEKLAAEEGKTPVEIITTLQGAAAKLDDDEFLLGQLIDLKSQYLGV